MSEIISKEEAKELLEEADRGILVLVNADPVPAIGDVPQEERKVSISSETYRFVDPGTDLSEADF